MKRKKRVTLRDIAERAECSVQVVSSILNRNGSVNSRFSRDLEEKITAIATDLNYQPPSKDSRSSRGKKRLCLVYGDQDFNKSSGPTIMETALELSKTWNFEISTLFPVNTDMPDELNDYLKFNDMDGILLINKMLPNLAELLEKVEVPLLAVNPAKRYSDNCIFHDDAGGVSAAIRTLATLGVERVAYCGGTLSSSSSHQSFNDRCLGVEKMCLENGISFLARYENFTRFFDDFSKLNVQVKNERVVLVFYSAYSKLFPDDFINSEFIRQQMGLRIPEQVDLFSLDGDEVGFFGHLDLQREMTFKIAIEKLLLMIEKSKTRVPSVTTPEKVVLKRRIFQAG